MLFSSKMKCQMFKKISESVQLNFFTLPKALFSGNLIKMYQAKQAWLSRYELIDETLHLIKI